MPPPRPAIVPRLLKGNTGPGGKLDTDRMSMALLRYHNTLLRDIIKSHLQLATGRNLVM